MMDEPQGLPETGGYATAAYNSGLVTGKIIERVGPLARAGAAFRTAEGAVPAAGENGLRFCQRAGDWRRRTLMRLAELLAGAGLDPALADLDIAGISADSRAVEHGFAFFAIPGHAGDGLNFVADAKARGASVVIAQREAPMRFAADRRRRRARRAWRWPPRAFIRASPRPSRPSPAPAARPRSSPSCVRFGASLGFEAASLGTVGVVDASGAHYGALTTPGPVELHRTLDELARRGVTHLAMEASSLGIDQRRLDGVRLTRRRLHQFLARSSRSSPRSRRLFRAKMRLFDTLLQPGQTRGDRRRQRCRAARPRGLRARGLKLFGVGAKGDGDRAAGRRPNALGDASAPASCRRRSWRRTAARRRLSDLQCARRGGSRHRERRGARARLRGAGKIAGRARAARARRHALRRADFRRLRP